MHLGTFPKFDNKFDFYFFLNYEKGMRRVRTILKSLDFLAYNKRVSAYLTEQIQ